MIDADGYRLNVGIILSNAEKKLFWGRRIGQSSWQFPQGGIAENESPLEAMHRELEEEVGLTAEHVEVLGVTKNWLHYDLPERYIRQNSHPLCIGQKQRWYLLKVDCNFSRFCFNTTTTPEFDAYRWVNYSTPEQEVVYFKRRVYERALKELAPYLFPEGQKVKKSRPRKTRYLRQHRR